VQDIYDKLWNKINNIVQTITLKYDSEASNSNFKMNWMRKPKLSLISAKLIFVGYTLE